MNMQGMNSRNYRSMMKEFSSHAYHESNYTVFSSTSDTREKRTQNLGT